MQKLEKVRFLAGVSTRSAEAPARNAGRMYGPQAVGDDKDGSDS